MRQVLVLAAAISVLGSLSYAQGPVMCPTRPTGDSSNACASTAFVGNQIIASPSGLTIGQAITGGTTNKILAVTPAGLLGQYPVIGSGDVVLANSPKLNSPTFLTPILGTPQSGTLTNATGLPISSGVTGLGTNVASALGVNVGSSGAFVVNGGVLGTPSSGTLTNTSGLPVGGITGFGTGVGTALGTNVGSAGSFVVNGGALGTPSSGTLTSATGLPISTGVTGLGAGVSAALATIASSPSGISVVLARGSTALYTNPITSATCDTAKSASASGALTSDVIAASFNGNPSAVTGYVPLTTGMLTILVYPSNDNVNFKVCNNTSSTITPGGITLNWRIAR